VISELSGSYPEKMVVVTDHYFPELSFPIRCECVEASNRPASIRKLVRKNSPRILNSHDPTTALLACISKVQLRMRSLRLTAFFYDEDILIPSLGRGCLARFLQFCRVPQFMLWLFLRVGVLNEIIVLDNRMAEIVKTKFRTNKVRVLRIGVSGTIANLERKVTEKKQLSSPPVVFFHGIIIPRRRVEDLLLAASRLRQEVIVRIGGDYHADRNYYVRLLRYAKSLGIGRRVLFLDDLDEDDLMDEYRTCDIFVFPCDHQTWGIAPLEAMILKKPVIVSTGSGVSEVLDDKYAVLVPPRNPARLTEAIEQLLENDELRGRLAQAGRDYVSLNLSFENTLRTLQEIWGAHT
jgi:glycosyltransferase involved in cell wall biosynthesis